MAQVHTHYDNLKVARDAPQEVIRAAYKTLSQKHHPDRNGNSKEAIRIIQLINSAYEVLSDPVRRQEHDDWIARAEQAARQESQRHTSPHAEARTRHSVHNTSRSHRHESRRSRRRPNTLVKLFHNAGAAWDRMCRKLARKVFGKV